MKSTIRIPDFKWLIDKQIWPIPTMPAAGNAIDTDEIEAWVKWAYECGKTEGVNIGLNAKSVTTFTSE